MYETQRESVENCDSGIDCTFLKTRYVGIWSMQVVLIAVSVLCIDYVVNSTELGLGDRTVCKGTSLVCEHVQ
jgi:hypothetical protein